MHTHDKLWLRSCRECYRPSKPSLNPSRLYGRTRCRCLVIGVNLEISCTTLQDIGTSFCKRTSSWGIGRVRIYLRSRHTNFRFNIIPLTEVWDISLEVKYVLAKDKSRWQNPHVPPYKRG